MKKITTESMLFKILLVIITTNSLLLSDIYIPSLPAIREYYDTENYIVQLSITYFMIGLALSAFVWGPLSDTYGRRRVMFIGFTLSIIATVFCLKSKSAEALALFRLFQGVGLGAARVLSRAISRDCFRGRKLAKLASYMAMWSSFFVAIGPIIGGYIQVYYDWRGCFVFMLVYQVLIFVVMFILFPETNPRIGEKKFKINTIISDYMSLLKDKIFVGYILCGAAAMGGIVSYVTASPFLLQDLCGLTPVQYGWMAIPICSATMAGGFLNSFFLDKINFKHLLVIGAVCILLSGLLMYGLASTGSVNTYVIVGPTLLMLLGFPVVTANAYAGASYAYPNIAGTVGAVYAAFQVLGGALTSAIIAFVSENSQMPLAVVFTCVGIIILLSITFLVNPALEKKLAAQAAG